MPCSPTDPPPIPVAWAICRQCVEHEAARATAPQYSGPGRLIAARAQRFAVTPTAAGWARRHVADVLQGWPVSELVDDACLVVSELITNVVQHAAADGRPQSCRVMLKLFANVLAVEVWDSSPRVSTCAEVDDLSDSGRGLGIVTAVCVGPPLWFVEPGFGKTVVALLPRSGNRQTTRIEGQSKRLL